MPATAVQPAWQTYADELAMLGYGLALWQPAPLHNYDKVKIGDVGYIRDGRFHLLFSAAIPLGDRRLGTDVPRNFVPVEPGPSVQDQPRVPGALHTQYIEQKGVGFHATSEITCIDVGTTLRFESSSKKGAILLTKYKTFREDAERLGFFKEYLLRNHQSWVDYANQLGHMVNLEDILLITGHDMTLDFAMLAFSSNSRQLGIEFEAGLPTVASAAASVWGTWRTTMSVHHNCGPQHREPPAYGADLITPGGPSSGGQGPQYNQCVFLRGFRIRKRVGLIPTVIKAAAGPHDLGPGHRFDEGGPCVSTEDAQDEEVVPISDIPSFIDPLDPLFRYMFENSNADVALLHEQDLLNLLEFTGTSTSESMEILISRLSPHLIEIGRDGVACVTFPQNGPSPISQRTDTIQRHKSLAGREYTDMTPVDDEAAVNPSRTVAHVDSASDPDIPLELSPRLNLPQPSLLLERRQAQLRDHVTDDLQQHASFTWDQDVEMKREQGRGMASPDAPQSEADGQERETLSERENRSSLLTVKPYSLLSAGLNSSDDEAEGSEDDENAWRGADVDNPSYVDLVFSESSSEYARSQVSQPTSARTAMSVDSDLLSVMDGWGSQDEYADTLLDASNALLDTSDTLPDTSDEEFALGLSIRKALAQKTVKGILDTTTDAKQLHASRHFRSTTKMWLGKGERRREAARKRKAKEMVSNQRKLVRYIREWQAFDSSFLDLSQDAPDERPASPPTFDGSFLDFFDSSP